MKSRIASWGLVAAVVVALAAAVLIWAHPWSPQTAEESGDRSEEFASQGLAGAPEPETATADSASGAAGSQAPGSGEAGALGPSARSVILMIGDGMGPEQVALGRIAKGSPLCFEEFAHRSAVSTLSQGYMVTDSAAGGTALATGCKTSNGRVSMAGDGESVPTILEMFRDRGARTGVVSTCEVVDATPAAFAAHVPFRYDWDEIAAQMAAKTGPDVVLGGGWGPMAVPVREAVSEGSCQLVRTRAELLAAKPDAAGRLLGLFSDDTLTFAADRGSDCDEPTLAEMTRAALATLSAGAGARKGLFLMVEGGRIDHACHGNDEACCAVEVMAFDRAVQAAIDWVDRAKAWDRTLLIVTADHETGGLAIRSDHKDAEGNPDDVTWSTGGHSDTPVPVYARGAGAEAVDDIRDNTEVFEVMKRFLEGRAAVETPEGPSKEEAVPLSSLVLRPAA